MEIHEEIIRFIFTFLKSFNKRLLQLKFVKKCLEVFIPFIYNIYKRISNHFHLKTWCFPILNKDLMENSKLPKTLKLSSWSFLNEHKGEIKLIRFHWMKLIKKTRYSPTYKHKLPPYYPKFHYAYILRVIIVPTCVLYSTLLCFWVDFQRYFLFSTGWSYLVSIRYWIRYGEFL